MQCLIENSRMKEVWMVKKTKRVINKKLVCNRQEDEINKNLIKEEGNSITKTGYASYLRHEYEDTM